MLTCQLDNALLDSNIRRLAKIYDVTIQHELRKQSRLVLQDCIKMTPPMNFGKATTESFDAQHKVGLNAVRAGVDRAFKTIDWIQESGPDKGGSSGKERFANRIRKLSRDGRFDVVQKIFNNNTRIKVAGSHQSASPYLHKTRRVKGRVPKQIWPYYIWDESSIQEVLRVRQANVGTAKSGWMKGAMALGTGAKFKIPPWILHGHGAGSFQEVKGDKPSIYVSNNVPYIQKTAVERAIVDRAMKNRLRNSTREVEHALAASLRRGGIKATAT